MLKKQLGFTLVELMIAVALVSIVSAVILPGFQGFQNSRKVKSTATNIYSGAQLTRAYAIQTNNLAALVINGKSWCLYDRSIDASTVTCDATNNTLTPGLIRKGIDTSAADVIGTPFPSGSSEITYNSLGQLVPNVASSSRESLLYYTVSLSNDSSRSLRVLLQNGVIKMCDLKKPAGSAQGC